MEFVLGQLVVLTTRNVGQNAEWEYGVVVNTFDNCIEIKKQYGSSLMYRLDNNADKTIDNQPTLMNVTPLTKDEKPVMSKKNLFGKYTFKPKGE